MVTIQYKNVYKTEGIDMEKLSEGLKKILLAGIGTVAVTAEKSKDVLDEMVKRGELTVEQGKVLNKEIEKPEKLGIIIENPGFLPEYSGYYNLHLFALIQNKIKKEEIREAMRIVGLDPDSKKHVGKYSLGMRQRLGIAQAIMEDPDILLLDEPLNGLDNEGVEEIRKVLLSLKEKGKLIILASHSKEDIQILCDTVFRMDHGKIIATETN